MPGVSKLSYTASTADPSGATFTEPVNSAGIDPGWLKEHPYLLPGTVDADGTYVAPDPTFLQDTGLVVPDLDPPGFNYSGCEDEDADCAQHRRDPETLTPIESHLVQYQKMRMLNTTPVDARVAYFKWTTTGALDLRMSAVANARLFEKLARLSFSNGVSDGTTIDLGESGDAHSFASRYERVQRDFPGMLPEWSPHSPFIEPEKVRNEFVGEDDAYRPGKPFFRYALKPCPGSTEQACCLSLESSMKMPTTAENCDPDNNLYCGRNNPVASLLRPGAPAAEVLTNSDENAAKDYRLAMKLGGVSTTFARAVPDISTASRDNMGLPSATRTLQTTLKDNLDLNADTPNESDQFGFRNSPKCRFLSKEGGGTRLVTMFLEHFYVGLTGEFEDIKILQKKQQRPWREGKTEYVRSLDDDDRKPKPARHVLEMWDETGDDLPTSERLAFVFGPDASNAEIGSTQFNDDDTPCSEVSGALYTRDRGESKEDVGTQAGGALTETRCQCRRTGKYEWALQAMLGPIRAGGTEFRPPADSGHQPCAEASSSTLFTDKTAYDNVMKASNRVVFWDVDTIFHVPGYNSAREDGPDDDSNDDPDRLKYSELVRLHTTAPTKGKDPEPFTNYRNLRHGIPGAENVLPMLTKDDCDELANHAELCDICKLAGNIQISQTEDKLNEGTCSTDPTIPVYGTGNGRAFTQLPNCCENGKVIEITSALIWNALKKVRSGSDYENIGDNGETTDNGGEHLMSGTGWRWFGDKTRGPADYGTSDGTPRSNFYQAICHVDPFVPTEFLMRSMGPIQMGANTPTSASGYNTMSAGTLWPGDSFESQPAEPAQSLGCATDLCARDFDDTPTEDRPFPTGKTFRFQPLKGAIERWDFDFLRDWPTQKPIRSVGKNPTAQNTFETGFRSKLVQAVNNGGSVKTVLTEADSLMSPKTMKEQHYGIHTCADQANRTFFTPWDFGGRGLLTGPGSAVDEAEDCSCCNSLGNRPLDSKVTVSTVGAEHWDMRWSFSRRSDNAGTQKNTENKHANAGSAHTANIDDPLGNCGTGIDQVLYFYGPAIGAYGYRYSHNNKDGQAPKGSSLGFVGATSDGRGESPHMCNNKQPRFPSFMADFINNVRYGDDKNVMRDNNHGYSGFAEATGCCSSTNPTAQGPELCECDTETDTNQAGEPCTSVRKAQDFYHYLKVNNNVQDSVDDTFDDIDRMAGTINFWKQSWYMTASQCFTYRTERGDGALVSSVRPARGGSAPATPTATMGAVRLPPIQQLYNNDTCPDWTQCGGGNCSAGGTALDRLNDGRLGAQTIGGSFDYSWGAWDGLNPNVLSTGSLHSTRCYNAIEKLGNVVGPLCVSINSKDNYPVECNSDDHTLTEETEQKAQNDGNHLRFEYHPPFIHPSKMGSVTNPVTHCPTSATEDGPTVRGPTVRGLDQQTELFEQDLDDQTATGRVSWGPRTFSDDGFKNPAFRLPKAQYHYTDTAPYVAGKNDGILECASSSNQAELRKELIRHSLLKSTDICDISEPRKESVGDDGVSLDFDRTATYRDGWSTCFNPADAALRFCRALIVDGSRTPDDPDLDDLDDPVSTCLELFGNGRSLGVRPEKKDQFETDGLLVETDVFDSDPLRARFPASCGCRGGDAFFFPVETDNVDDPAYRTERLSWVSTLCACGSVARSAKVVVGTVAEQTNYDYLKPEFLAHDGETEPNTAFCGCTEAEKEAGTCRTRHRCSVAGLGADDLTAKLTEGLVEQTELASLENDFGASLEVIPLPINHVVRRTVQFKTGSSTFNVPFPFTAVERAALQACLSGGPDCESSQESFGDAVLTYPLGDTPYPRAVIVAPTGTACPNLEPGQSDSALTALVTGTDAPYPALAPLFEGNRIGTIPIKSDNVKPQPVVKPAASTDNPVFDYMNMTNGFINDETVNAVGCLVVSTENNPAGFVKTFNDIFENVVENVVSIHETALEDPANHWPLSVPHDFVFGDGDGDGTAVLRFSRLLRDCLELMAAILTGPATGELSDRIQNSLCYGAVSGRGAAAVDTADPISVAYVVPAAYSMSADAAVVASGGCTTITGVDRLFTVVGTPDDGTLRSGTLVLPVDCDSDIYYQLMIADDAAVVAKLDRETGNPTTVLASEGKVEPPLAVAGRVTVGNKPMPFMAAGSLAANLFSQQIQFRFPFKRTPFPGVNTYNLAPSAGTPCWRSVCQDVAVGGRTRLVVSGAGRFPVKTEFFQAALPTTPFGTCAPAQINDDTTLNGGTCGLFESFDADLAVVCENYKATLSPGRAFSDWLFPENPTDDSLVAEAPLIAVCHPPGLRTDPGHSRIGAVVVGASGESARVPAGVIFGHPLALTIRVTAFLRPELAFGTRAAEQRSVFLTALGTVVGETMAAPAGGGNVAVVPLLSIPRPAAAPTSTSAAGWYAAAITGELNRPPTASADISQCRLFENAVTDLSIEAVTGRDQAWTACVGALAPVATVIPAEYWTSSEGAVVLSLDGTPGYSADLGSPTVPSVCSPTTATSVFVENAWPLDTKTPNVDLIVVFQATKIGGLQTCLSECATTLACTTIFYGPATGLCALYTGAVRTIAFQTGILPVVTHASSGTPDPDRGVMAFCVGTASNLDVRRALFSRPTTVFSAAVAAGEPCPDRGTAAAIDPAGRQICVWTPCDVDGPGATEFTRADGSLGRVHGYCPDSMVEATVEPALVEINRASSEEDGGGTTTLWTEGDAVLLRQIGILPADYIEFVFATPFTRPTAAAPASDPVDAATAATHGMAAVIDLPAISAGAYVKSRCTWDANTKEFTAVAPDPTDPFPGVDFLSTPFDAGASDCPCPDVTEDPL